MDKTIYAKNMTILREIRPSLAQLVEHTALPHATEVQYGPKGLPVPLVIGNPLHNPLDPAEEAQQRTKAQLGDCTQQRLLMVGFGFGYDVEALCSLGYSPLVYEPDTALFKLALHYRDFSSILPRISLYLGSTIPSIPPLTKVLIHPAVRDSYPLEVARLGQRQMENPPEGCDITHGEKCETYRNVTCLKNPFFMTCYQMIISLVRPNIVIEVGACRGGSALFLSDLMTSLRCNGHVYTIDIVNDVAPEVLEQDNITFSSLGHASFDLSFIKPSDRVLVIEDSSHTYPNTLEVLNRFHQVVTPNSYFIVEDTASDTPALAGGPMRAVNEFLPAHPEFERDLRWERFFGPEYEGHCIFMRRRVS